VLDVERMMNDSWRASGRLRQLGPTRSTTSAVPLTPSTSPIRRAQRSAPKVGQAFYINYPDRRESSATMPSGSHHLNQTASIRPASRQQTCSLTAGNIDEAFWQAFLFVHFGKHSKAGWRLARDFYAGSGPQARWTWARVSRNLSRVSKWLEAQRPKWVKDGVRRHFGNHRKFESLKETGKAIESYVTWVGAPGHSKLIAKAIADVGPDRRAVFDHLYRSMASVWSFGRTARFDYLTLLGKLDLAPIDPASAYLVGATGPLDGVKQLFGRRSRKLRPHDLEEKLLELGNVLGVNQQVLEDAICNWQKSPKSFRPFRG
jgi:hypothetical protein